MSIVKDMMDEQDEKHQERIKYLKGRLADAEADRMKMSEHFHACCLCTECYQECNGEDPPAVRRAKENKEMSDDD